MMKIFLWATVFSCIFAKSKGDVKYKYRSMVGFSCKGSFIASFQTTNLTECQSHCENYECQAAVISPTDCRIYIICQTDRDYNSSWSSHLRMYRDTDESDYAIYTKERCAGDPFMSYVINAEYTVNDCFHTCDIHVCDGFHVLNGECQIYPFCNRISGIAGLLYHIKHARNIPGYSLYEGQTCDTPALSSSFRVGSLLDCVLTCSWDINCTSVVFRQDFHCFLKNRCQDNKVGMLGHRLYLSHYESYSDYHLKKFNVALGKPTNSSSEELPYFSSAAVDSFYGDNGCSVTKSTMDNYWEVDLINQYDIYAVNIQHGYNCCDHLNVLTSNSSINGNGDFSFCVQNITNLGFGYYNYTCNSVQFNKRFVIVKHTPETEAKPLVLCEVEVIAGGIWQPATDKVCDMSSPLEISTDSQDCSNAIDGNTSPLFKFSGTCLGLSHASVSTYDYNYFQVDFTENLKVLEVVVFQSFHHAQEFKSVQFFVTLIKFDGTLRGNEQYCSITSIEDNFKLIQWFSCSAYGRYFVLYQKNELFKTVAMCEISITTECRHDTYGLECKQTCENCGDFGCSSTGTCLGGCAPGWYGPDTCHKACIGHCLNNICDYVTGECNIHCEPGYYRFPTCINKCGHCVDGICDEIDGSCQCEPFFAGQQCDIKCPEKCILHYCDDTGNCSRCEPGFSGPLCDNTCIGHCLRHICDSITRECTIHCEPGYYPFPICNHKCGENCVEEMCDEIDGSCPCNPTFAGQRCDIKCPENCIEYCHEDSGNCSRCPPGFAGPQCDTKCLATHCKDNTCDEFGTCFCADGYYGLKCDQECPTNCKDGKCEEKSGICTCIDGYFGKKCEIEYVKKNCMENIDYLMGSCPSCKAGYYTTSCNKECPINCKDNYCHQLDGTCFNCSDGFYGEDCSKECGHCTDECDRLSGVCICKDGYYGTACDKLCPANCKNQSCDQVSGFCHCKDGFFASDCSQKCSSDCKDGICDKHIGVCLSCLDGLFGVFCRFPCSSNCLSGKCEQYSGDCID